MLKRTKIVATLGPASSSEEVLTNLITAGVDVIRLNFSHGEPDEHINRAQLIRKIARAQNRYVAILGDLQGPKIRITRFKDGEVILRHNQSFTLDADLDSTSGTEDTVGITYSDLINDCNTGDVLLLDDGRITMSIQEKTDRILHCKVIQGGTLSNNKGINLQGGGLSAPALTEKDIKDIKLAAKINVDYLAVSFVRRGSDLKHCRQLLRDAECKASVLAKIERAEVVASQSRLEEVIRASDAVMVARGDLGVEIGDAELVAVQKNMIATARKLNRPVITATQMMESMIQNSLPTRAEVFDVANAVLDGTDAVMLSAETAVGHCPHGVVTAMHRIVSGAEKPSENIKIINENRVKHSFATCDETIAVSAMYAANQMEGIKGIVCLTKTGQTALWMSRINSTLPIFAFSRSEATCRRMALYRGVYPCNWTVDPAMTEQDREDTIVRHLKEFGFQPDDKVILTFGERYKSTNTLKIMIL